MNPETGNASNSRQIKTIIFIALLAIIVLHLFSSLPGLYRTVVSLQNARRVSFLNEVSDHLFTAVGNYGFERGRVNVVLNDAGPVAGMEKNRRFIAERRDEGDAALSMAFDQLYGFELQGLKKKIRQVKALNDQVRKLRMKTDRDLIVSKDEREKGLAGIWFKTMTRYIESIESLLVTISVDISNSDGVISRYSSLKHEALALRNTAGPEMSILSATILSGEPINEELKDKIENLHIITQHHFQTLSFFCQGLSSPVIPDALNELKQIYFSDYIPYRDEIFPLVITGGPYPYSQEEFLGHGVRALKSIAHFMEVIVSETKAYASFKLDESRKQLIFQGFSSAGSLLAVFLIMFYINSRVISPIGHLTLILRRLAGKQLDIDVPLLEEKNEIGEMATALEIFRETSVKLDEDNRLLQIAEEKIRTSEEKLKLILNSIPDMIVECDADLNVIWANKSALEVNPESIGQTCYSAFWKKMRSVTAAIQRERSKPERFRQGFCMNLHPKLQGKAIGKTLEFH